MKLAIRILFAMAMVSLACFLSGLLLYELSRAFPEMMANKHEFGDLEVWGDPPEGSTLGWLGFMGFAFSAPLCLLLTLLEWVLSRKATAIPSPPRRLPWRQT